MTAAIEHALALADARLESILCDGRGRDGSLGTQAQGVALAAGTFRRIYAPLSDPGTADELFHRGAYLSWLSIANDPRNTRDPRYLLDATCELTVGYVAGTSETAASLVHVAPGSTEVQTTLARYPSLYALGDARRIQLALEMPALFQDASDPHPIVDVQRQGSAAVVSITPTRVICTQTFLVRLWAASSPSPATP